VLSPRRFGALLPLFLVFALVVAACGGDDDDDANASDTTAGNTQTTAGSEPVTLRLGYFGNTTHAPAIVGIEHGEFEQALGANVTLETSVFNAGPAAVEAIFGGSLDASFIGPNPAINAYAQSQGDAVRVVSGTASGGAYLVVKPGLTAKDLKGKTLATPQLGNTQDVALRTWLKDEGYATDTAGGGDVKILPQENSQTLDTFKAGQIDGAWVPEPWATRLVTEGGGEVLVDEKDLWPGGKYVTTQLLVTTEFLDDHPDVVQNLISGLGAAIDFIKNAPDEANPVVADGIEKATGKPIKPELVTASFENIDFTLDPVPSSLLQGAKNAEAVGLLDPVDDLEGIYELKELNAVLKERGEPEVTVT
jgi:sulfonate transport system substrate-binding protein